MRTIITITIDKLLAKGITFDENMVPQPLPPSYDVQITVTGQPDGRSTPEIRDDERRISQDRGELVRIMGDRAGVIIGQIIDKLASE